MLVLTRKPEQSIMVGCEIEITILEVRGEQVRVGINAPRSVAIHRKEVFEQIRDENRSANAATSQTLPTIGEILSGTS